MSYRDVSYSRSRSRSPRGSDREFRPRTKELDSAPKVFVGNLSHDTEESEFRAHFDHCGKIVEILVSKGLASWVSRLLQVCRFLGIHSDQRGSFRSLAPS